MRGGGTVGLTVVTRLGGVLRLRNLLSQCTSGLSRLINGTRDRATSSNCPEGGCDKLGSLHTELGRSPLARTDSSASSTRPTTRAGRRVISRERRARRLSDSTSRLISSDLCIKTPVCFFFILGANRLASASRLVGLSKVTQVTGGRELRVQISKTTSGTANGRALGGSLKLYHTRCVGTRLVGHTIPDGHVRVISRKKVSSCSPGRTGEGTYMELLSPPG